MKSKILIAIAGLLVLIGIYLVVKTLNKSQDVTVLMIDEHTDNYDIHVEYPKFKNIEDGFNSKIEDIIDSSIKSFKNEAEASRDSRSVSSEIAPPFQFSAGWVPEQVNEKIISFALNISFYTGGAHGGHIVHTFNYDVEAKSEITLEKLFEGSPGYLEKISRYAISDLKAGLERQGGGNANISLIEEVAAPVGKNFNLFTISPGNIITFYFPEYSVAPYADGQQRVMMPISFIRTN
jgi:hypothetical protein